MMMMRIMIMILKVNLQMPIRSQLVNTGCGEMGDDDDDDKENESSDANMVAASEYWLW